MHGDGINLWEDPFVSISVRTRPKNRQMVRPAQKRMEINASVVPERLLLIDSGPGPKLLWEAGRADTPAGTPSYLLPACLLCFPVRFLNVRSSVLCRTALLVQAARCVLHSARIVLRRFLSFLSVPALHGKLGARQVLLYFYVFLFLLRKVKEAIIIPIIFPFRSIVAGGTCVQVITSMKNSYFSSSFQGVQCCMLLSGGVRVDYYSCYLTQTRLLGAHRSGIAYSGSKVSSKTSSLCPIYLAFIPVFLVRGVAYRSYSLKQQPIRILRPIVYS